MSARPGVALGLAAATVGAALPAWASWTGVPPTLRSAVLAATALTAAGLAQTVPRWFAGTSRLGRLAWILAAAAVVVHVIAYDPFADLQCSRVCRSTAGPWWEGPASETVVAGEGLLVLAAVSVGLVGVVVGRSVPPWSGVPRGSRSPSSLRRCSQNWVARQRGVGADDVVVDAVGTGTDRVRSVRPRCPGGQDPPCARLAAA